MWTVFHGPAEDPGPIQWELFEFEPRPTPKAGSADPIERRMAEMCAWFEEPEIDDEWVSNNDNWRALFARRPDDLDAALAFLRRGGTLCKVPDTETSPYWRLCVVHDKEEEGTCSTGK